MVSARNLFRYHHPAFIPIDYASELFKVPLDRVDPISVNCSATSLWFLSTSNGFRQSCTRGTHHPIFKGFILFIILLNSITIALRDPQLQDVQILQELLDITDIVFISLFALEMVMKVISYGFLLHAKSYLRHPWNIIDAVVVVSGCVALFVDSGGGVSALRVIRVFRPLRAFAYVKSLRHILNRLVKSVPKMADVFELLIFIIWLLDVIGVHLFMGCMNSRCWADVSGLNISNLTDLNVMVRQTPTGDNRTFALIINDTSLCAQTYPSGRRCSVETNGVALPQECLTLSELSGADSVFNFNNAAYAFLLVFKVVCRDNWPDDYVHLSESIGIMGGFCYMFVATLFAGYFCVNLFIAVFEAIFSAKDDDDDIDTTQIAKVNFTTVLGARTVAHASVFVSTWRGRTVVDSYLHHPSSGAQGQTDADDNESEGFPLARTRSLLQSLEADRGPSQDDDDDIERIENSRAAFEPGTRANERSEGIGASQKPLSGVVNYIRRFFRRTGVKKVGAFCDSGLYQLFLIILVVLNASVLAVDRVGLSDIMNDMIQWSSFTFTILFLLDAAVKLVGYGPSYFQSMMNVADFVLCVISIPDVVKLENSAFTSLRAFRLVRLLRISDRWTDLRQKLDLLGEAVQAVGSLSLVAFIIMYIYAILGFQLFGKDIDGMRMSFATVFDSLLTVFICITGEDQNGMTAFLANDVGLWSAIYFVSLTVFGNFVLTNLFIAIILENFATKGEASCSDQDVLEQQPKHHSGGGGGGGALTASNAFEKIRPPTAHDKRRVLLEPDEVGTTSKGALSSSPDDEDHQIIDDDNDDHRRTDPTIVDRPRRHEGTSTYLAAGTQIAQVVGVRGSEPLFQAYATEQRSLKTFLVPSASALAAEAERQINEMEDDMEDQHGPNRIHNTFHGIVGDVLQQRRKSQAIRSSIAAQTSEAAAATQRFTLEDFTVKFRKFQTIAEGESHQSKWEGLQYVSFCFPPSNRLRQRVGSIMRHAAVEWTLVCVTLMSSIFLVLDNDHVIEDRASLILVTDVLFCAIFMFEAVLKIFVLGLYQHPGSYFRSMWNIVDLFVAVFSFIALFETDLKLFRAFRVLRMLNLSFTLRVITSSILAAIPGMTSVMVFVGLLFLIYAVLGVALFKGRLSRCSDPLIPSFYLCNGTFNHTVQGAFSTYTTVEERQWVPSFSGCSYDNIEGAFYCLFRLANQDNWYSQMYAAVDDFSSTSQSTRNASPLASLYFISFMVVGQFFAVNLFIGVLVDRFLVQRRRGEGHALLTPTQQQWILVQKVLFRAEVRGEPQRPPGWRSVVFDLCSHWLFDYVMYLLIAANSVLLSAYYFDMSPSLRDNLDTINIILIALFTLEVILKCVAFGPWSYFGLLWNRLDVLVVVLSWIGVGMGEQSTVVGVFRVSRLLMLLRKMKGLQTLFVTLYHAVPEFLNVALVLMVLYFVFAIIGVQLFSQVPRGKIITDYINFEHAGSALITLYIMMTQEAWGDITDELAMSSAAAIPYSISFMIIVSWVAINLLVTVVIDVFGEAEETEKQDASLRVIDHFRQVWCSYDPNGTKLLPVHVVLRILPTMPSSIWDRSSMKNGHASPWVCVLRQLERLHIPVDSYKRVRYEDCIGSLALRLFSLSTTEAIHVSQSTIHGVIWQHSHFSIHHEYAALMISRTYRRYQASRRERQLETQVRTLRDQHAIVVETELQPLRRAYHEAINLIRWMASRDGGAISHALLEDPLRTGREAQPHIQRTEEQRAMLVPDDDLNDAGVEIVFGAEDELLEDARIIESAGHHLARPTQPMEESMGIWAMSVLDDGQP